MKALPLQILVNHLGYEAQGSKSFVVQSAGEVELPGFEVLDGDGKVVFEGPLQKTGTVDGWKGRFFHQGDFSTLVKPGRYQIKVKELRSERFQLGARLLPEACLSDLLYYFRIQRSSGAHDKAAHALAFFGEPQRPRVDVHGGWYDASGDVSKYLSHLSEANYMNPQQAPMAVWCFLQSVDLLRAQKSQRLQSVMPLLREEALYGADFLMRMQDPSGYFYMSLHDGCSRDPAQLEVCGYKGLTHGKHGETKAGLREGGGMAIAALARVSTLKQNGDYTPAQYLAAAEKGFLHLTRHNLEYIDDHQENILDDYCGLLAATELYSVTTNPLYLQAARARAESLAGRLAKDEHYAGWWRADADGKRPFFHAVDAGLPVVALCRYQQIESDAGRKAAAGKAVTESLRFELALTKEVANPFGYARQYIKDPDGKRGSFFMPHRNETGYWWSGENARLASLASAALLGRSCTPPEMIAELKAYGKNQVNWILGLNPYDLCMVQGKGRNNPGDYEEGMPNPPGGICNGITSGVEDERDIAFLPAPYGQRGDWSWRWSEQWIPHSSWLILALAAECAADPVAAKRQTVLLDKDKLDAGCAPGSYEGREPDASWRKAAAERIEKYRKADLAVRVVDTQGRPVSNAAVSVHMTQQAFPFGSCVSAGRLVRAKGADADRYRRMVDELFSHVTIEIESCQILWEQDKTVALDAMKWLKEHGKTIHGCHIVWPHPKDGLPADVVALKNDPKAMRQRMMAHIDEKLAACKGLVSEWNAVNELYTNPLIEETLGKAFILEIFKRAKQIDPSLRLDLNDFGDMANVSRAHIEGSLAWVRYAKEQGIQMDVVGLQCHFNSFLRPMDEAYAILERYAAFGYPIHVTELDVNINDEPLQADFMRDMLTMLYSHPAVEKITLWGFWEGAQWMPLAALWRKDWSIKPIGSAWMNLVKTQWTTSAELKTDENGSAKLRAFHGDYEVTATAGGKSAKAAAGVGRDGARVEIRLQ